MNCVRGVCVCVCVFQQEGRKYCEKDFHVLFAPCCSGCGKFPCCVCQRTHFTQQLQTHPGEFIVGRVIRAMSQCWHPTCFKCVSCHCELADVGFVKNQGRSVITRAVFVGQACAVLLFVVLNRVKHDQIWYCRPLCKKCNAEVKGP